MDFKIGWNFLVSEYKKNYDSQEDKIQTLWESYFAMPFTFNYSDSDDIDSKRSLHIGASDREIPDIILRANHKNLCIVELKRYTLPKKIDYEKQLLNYMAHTDMRLSIGVLICKTLNIYYYNQATNEQECLEIPFEEESPLGEKFVQLFSKDNFSEEKIKLFIREKKESENAKEIIKSEINIELIKQLLKEHFMDKFNSEDILTVISNLNISLNKNTTNDFQLKQAFDDQIKKVIINSEKTTVNLNGVTLPIYRKDEQSVQDFIKQTLKILFESKLLTNNEILLLQDKNYSQNVFSIEYPLLEKNHINTIDNKGHSRYWAKKNFSVGDFFVCSQWWKQKFDIYDKMIAIWLVSLENERNKK